MSNDAFKKFKRHVVYPAIQRLRKVLVDRQISCVADTNETIQFEFGSYDVETHRLEDLPTFKIEFADCMVKVIVDENLLTKIPLNHVNFDWLNKELCQWISCNLRRQLRHSGYSHALMAQETPALKIIE